MTAGTNDDFPRLTQKLKRTRQGCLEPCGAAATAARAATSSGSRSINTSGSTATAASYGKHNQPSCALRRRPQITTGSQDDRVLVWREQQ